MQVKSKCKIYVLSLFDFIIIDVNKKSLTDNTEGTGVGILKSINISLTHKHFSCALQSLAVTLMSLMTPT